MYLIIILCILDSILQVYLSTSTGIGHTFLYTCEYTPSIRSGPTVNKGLIIRTKMGQMYNFCILVSILKVYLNVSLSCKFV